MTNAGSKKPNSTTTSSIKLFKAITTTINLGKISPKKSKCLCRVWPLVNNWVFVVAWRARDPASLSGIFQQFAHERTDDATDGRIK